MSNITKIKISGTSYNIKDENACNVVELTQAEYDALPASAKTSNSLFVITDAQGADLSNYYTKSETSGATEISTALASKADTATTYTKTEVDNAITAATASKQDTLVSGTNIKTINNESLLGSGNIDIQGGGKAIEAGRGIAITTGETADTVSFDLPIYNKGNYSISECHMENNDKPYCSSNFCHLEQPNGGISSDSHSSHKEGLWSKIGGSSVVSHVEGYYCEVGKFSPYSHAEGQYTKTSNQSEHASGQYNVSSHASYAFGNSGNTLFSVGNGTSNSARHNAFEIRQNGDIYLTKDGQDVKLQDQLGGSITVDTALDSGSTNPVENRVIYNKIDEVEQVTAAGLNVLNDNFGGLKLMKISQTDYDNLQVKDQNTLYIVI